MQTQNIKTELTINGVGCAHWASVLGRCSKKHT